MRIHQESRTALVAAFYRAHHYAHDTPKIFEDSLAHLMLSAAEEEFFADRRSERLKRLDPALAASCPDRTAMVGCFMRATPAPAEALSRARYAEDILEEAVSRGVGQYVLIGAGMDTFAFRRPDLNVHLQVFEVDREEVQRFKRQRLVEVSLQEPRNLHFVAVDYARENLDTALERSEFDPHVPAFFGWLGVTMYLDCDTVLDTLNAIKRVAAVGSHLVFDYLDADAFDPSRSSESIQELIERMHRSHEPLVAGFDPKILEADICRIGFNVRENLSPLDIEARYFQGRADGYHATDHAHFVWAVVE